MGLSTSHRSCSIRLRSHPPHVKGTTCKEPEAPDLKPNGREPPQTQLWHLFGGQESRQENTIHPTDRDEAHHRQLVGTHMLFSLRLAQILRALLVDRDLESSS